MVLHPQAEAALALWSQGPAVTDPGFAHGDLLRMRAAARHEAAGEPREPVDRVADVAVDGVPCRAYLPSGAVGTLVYLHGGGFVFGDLDTHDAQARRLANRTGRAVVSVDYRRPPEHRFPAAPDDVDRVVRRLRASGGGHHLPGGPLAVLGDSAGGNLALVAALRNPGAFAALVLVYPFLDPTTGSAGYRSQENRGLTGAEARWYWHQYAAHPDDLRDPDVAPLLAGSLAGLPPTLVQAAEHDALVSENESLAHRIEADGGLVTLTTYPGLVHGFWRHPQLFDTVEPALAEAAGFLARHL